MKNKSCSTTMGVLVATSLNSTRLSKTPSKQLHSIKYLTITYFTKKRSSSCADQIDLMTTLEHSYQFRFLYNFLKATLEINLITHFTKNSSNKGADLMTTSFFVSSLLGLHNFE